MEILGHIIGFIGIGIFFLSYQVLDKKNLLVLQGISTAASCIQYLLIGAYSGFALNAAGIVRNIIFYHRDKKYLSGKWIPYAIAVIFAGLSFLSWDGIHSLCITIGLMINAVCMAFCESQGLRKSVFVTSPIIMIYNIIEHSYSGIATETIALTSALIGIIRYNKAKKTASENVSTEQKTTATETE